MQGLLVVVAMLMVLIIEEAWGLRCANFLKINNRGGLLPLGSSVPGSMAEGENQQYGNARPERSKIPQRRDTCKVFISGVIGTDPREAFLSNGHYVMNFGLAVVGHFNPLHSWEEYKPTETMWTNIEVWDDVARAHQTQLTKGSPLSGLGTLILNKWTDKNTGEDRKQLKLRLTHILGNEEMQEMLGASGALDMDEEGLDGAEDDLFGNDSGFSNFNQIEEDQSANGFGGGGSDDRIPF